MVSATTGAGVIGARSLPGATCENSSPVLAGRIVAHRDSIGGFTSVEQLLEVDGIGDKTFAALRDLVTV